MNTESKIITRTDRKTSVSDWLEATIGDLKKQGINVSIDPERAVNTIELGRYATWETNGTFSFELELSTSGHVVVLTSTNTPSVFSIDLYERGNENPGPTLQKGLLLERLESCTEIKIPADQNRIYFIDAAKTVEIAKGGSYRILQPSSV